MRICRFRTCRLHEQKMKFVKWFEKQTKREKFSGTSRWKVSLFFIISKLYSHIFGMKDGTGGS